MSDGIREGRDFLVSLRGGVATAVRKMRKRVVVGCCLGTLLGIFVFTSNNDLIQRMTPFFVTPPEDISCYIEVSTPGSVETLLTADVKSAPKGSKNIFFHETSCFGDEGITLTPRQACAVESAAKMNPTMQVYLLVLSHSNFSAPTKETVTVLSAYKNVKIRRIFMEEYVKNTPLEEWWVSGILRTSKWPRSHMSDILRSLEKFTNFAGAEDWEDVAAGVLGFGTTGLGRRIADACLRDLKKNFRGNVWGNNGPGVITRTLQKLCATKYARDMTPHRCRGFTVYPPSAFYPIHYKKWKLYFDEKEKNSTMSIIRRALAIHVWNKLSSSEIISPPSQVPYALVASEYCPKVYTHSGKLF
ncbi:lactosylceramide 4-alpha-galactosyltransferase isoform X2 [Diachasma alloeum]|uniref:lactosylceramide 4-alpha-galactosyltransferase isoform X2 n=1 Tax=Diachasma alloeum TaxID=454923 RepID=UPI0007381BB1|nr:lactosylceramide 4-alpha-galactosyltransferase isoform X2 [Diachasma alloeum]